MSHPWGTEAQAISVKKIWLFGCSVFIYEHVVFRFQFDLVWGFFLIMELKAALQRFKSRYHCLAHIEKTPVFAHFTTNADFWQAKISP